MKCDGTEVGEALGPQTCSPQLVMEESTLAGCVCARESRAQEMICLNRFHTELCHIC